MMKLIYGDCLDKLQYTLDKSIDMVLADPPYGKTACKWDSIIDLDLMWQHLKRIIKDNGVIILMAGQPFTSALIMSNIKMFKYCWYWNKVNAVRNHLNAKKQPMRIVEDVTVFYKKQCLYIYQKREGNYISRKTKPSQTEGFRKTKNIDIGRHIKGLYPIDLLSIKGHHTNKVYHPTQKPVVLMEYLIKTYTKEKDTVLDFCMGSGTTGIACLNLGRNFIGIEKDKKYFQIAKERIKNEES